MRMNKENETTSMKLDRVLTTAAGGPDVPLLADLWRVLDGQLTHADGVLTPWLEDVAAAPYKGLSRRLARCSEVMRAAAYVEILDHMLRVWDDAPAYENARTRLDRARRNNRNDLAELARGGTNHCDPVAQAHAREYLAAVARLQQALDVVAQTDDQRKPDKADV